MCYGLRTDFMGNVFEGSCALLAIADLLNEGKPFDDKLNEALLSSSAELDDIIREIGKLVHSDNEE